MLIVITLGDVDRRLVRFGAWPSLFLAVGITIAAGWGAAAQPLVTAALILSLPIAMFAVVARPSAAKTFALLLVLLGGLPVIPGLQEQRTPQLVTLALVSGASFASAARMARQRSISPRGAYLAAGVPLALTLVTTGVLNPSQLRLLIGTVLALGVGASFLLGRIATTSERRQILVFTTILAQIMALIGLFEAATRRPLYVFTPWQSPNVDSAFRSTALLGQPLVLSTLLVVMAVANMARPEAQYPLIVRNRFLTVSILLAGAATSASRSAVLMLIVGILAVLSSGTGGAGARRRGFAVVVTAVAVAFVGLALLSPTSALGSRFQLLSGPAADGYRLAGPQVVASITKGSAWIIGNGPRAVSIATSQDVTLTVAGTVDDQLLTNLADFGVIGVVWLVVLLAEVVLALRRPQLDAWRRMAVLSGAGLVAEMFVFDALEWWVLMVLFGFAVGSARLPVPRLGHLAPKAQTTTGSPAGTAII
jgi:hypothetical protein